jgi:pSer/pThr/pTyr-binding forkhead associated (FHA) protein
MAATIRLTVLTGPHKGNRYCFRESHGTTLGRGSGCDICFCGSAQDLCISRRHCQLTFDPPNVCVDDLGSANGTYVNGHPCAASVSDVISRQYSAPMAAKDGDILTIGGTSLQISIIDCPEWNEEERVKKNCPAEC